MRLLLIFLISFLAAGFLKAQNVGAKVTFVAIDGKSYTGVITAIQNGLYKVKYDGYNYEAWLPVDQFKLVSGGSDFMVGEKVEVWNVTWYPASVIEVKNGLYKIHYQDWVGYPDEWVKDDRVKKFGSMKDYKATSKSTGTVTTTGAKPSFNAGVPDIVGTSWGVVTIYKKGTTPSFDRMDNYIFCNNGHWEFLANHVANRGTYKVQGDRVTIMQNGNRSSTYKMIWNEAGNYLELDDGVMIIRLRYNMKTTC